MASFKPEALVEKLGKLQPTQQSIEMVSQYCIFFKKDAKSVVATWETEFNATRELHKRLSLLYLANDILQNSRKKGPHFVNEFYHKLPPAIAFLLKHGDDPMRRQIGRMIRVWEERRVFGSSGLKPFTDLLQGAHGAAAKPAAAGRRVVLEAADPSVERLAGSVAEAAAAHERCRALGAQCEAALAAEDGGGDGSAEGLRASLRSLQGLAAALQNELGHRERVLALLRQLAGPHEAAKQAAEERLGVCQLRAQSLQQRLAAAPPAALPASPAEEAAQSAAAPQAEANGSHSQGRPQPAAAAAPLQPATGAGTDPPQDGAAPAAGGQPQGGATPGFSAADLVAQLARSGTSAQMLLDALAALPQGAGEGLAALQQPPPPPPPEAQPMEEEYDPELGM